jgi:hypothetical protein
MGEISPRAAAATRAAQRAGREIRP